MLINNTDTVEYNATLLDRDIGNADIITIEDWENNWIEPFRYGQYFKYIPINCEFEIDTNSDEIAIKDISKLIKESATAILKFDDLPLFYEGYLESHEKEKIIRGKYIINLSWKCKHAFESEIIETIITTKTINLTSTVETPVIIEINPAGNREKVNIRGFGEDIEIKNLTAGNKVIIDGEKGLVTENGQNKWLDYDSWGFPKLEPGENRIITEIPITVKYKPRWI